MNEQLPNGWKIGDSCFMVTCKQKKYTGEYIILQFDGRFFFLKEKNNNRFHRASPGRIFRNRVDAVASLCPKASQADIEELRTEFPVGTRVELVKMDDPYRTDLVPGTKGTVTCVDDSGSIHVNWDCHSSLAVIFGHDICRKIES